MNALLFACFALLALAERLPALRRQAAPFLRRHFATDALYLATGVLALGLAMRAAAEQLVAGAGPLASLSLAWPAPATALAAVLLYDLGGYASHWLLHRFAALWRVHEVHHSSRSLDWLAAFRAHALEHALRHLLSPVALLLLGVPAGAVALAAVVYGSWAAFNHSNLRLDLRALEPVLITPRLHRLHHVPATSERNLGTILSVWDRLRGTLVTDPDAALEPIGVPGAIESYPQSWLGQLVAPWRRLRSA
jgi:sterol desaturase/sphingolipid hydroxylase (fatty acid hydroxylase superfamily)